MVTKEDIEKLAKSNIGKYSAYKLLGLKSSYELKKLCKEYNIEWPDYNSYRRSRPDIDKQWLIDNWVNTDKSMHQLAVENNVSEALLDWRRAHYSLVKSFKYNIDTCKLFNLNDPNIYYLAGLAVTDGYFPEKLNALELELAGESEEELLFDIYNYFDQKCKLKKYKGYYRLRISCSGLNDFFEKNFNIPQKAKSFDADIPSSFPSADCAAAYIRGCLDGDGSISKNGKGVILLTASEKLVYGLADVIYRYCGVEMTRSKQQGKNNTYYRISCYSTNTLKLLSWVYKNKDELMLKRKYERFMVYYKSDKE